MKTRPLLPQHLRRASILRIRVRRSERRVIEQGARAAGLSIAEFLRTRALATPSRETAEPHPPAVHRREDATTSASSRIRRGSR